MAKLDNDTAHAICNVFGINPALDWHEMPSAMKEAVIKAADSRGYRKPETANGSRGRYFAAYLRRAMESGK